MADVRTRSDGARIHYDDVGQGEPVLLFLPGWCTTRAVFGPLLEGLQAKHRLLVMDLRGHGKSESSGDFDSEALVDDAAAVVEASGASNVVPVALSHAGWVAIELRRLLGERVRGMVFVDWLVLDAPPPFLDVLKGLQSSRWQEVRDTLFGMWTAGVDSEAVTRFIREDMASFPGEMWKRAAREISRAYEKFGNPLQALTQLEPPPPALHLYAQQEDPASQIGQQSFANSHPWFEVVKLHGRSHFPMLEVPGEMVANIERFTAGLRSRYAFQAPQAPA